MRRVLAAGLLTLLGASFVAFGFMHLAPMDPARFMIGFRQGVREEQIHRLREWYRLDTPIPFQYALWAGRAARGEFGTSLATRRDIGPEIWRRLPWSLLLAASAAVTAWLLAVPLAVAAAGRGAFSWAGRGVIALGVAIPVFLVASATVYAFAVRLTLIPILPPFELNPFDAALWLGLLLPTISLSVPVAAWLAQQLRGELSEVLGARFLEAARARGLSERRVLWRHAAGVAAKTVLARPLPALSVLLSGLLVVEEIFNWPGIGRSFTRAVGQRDIPVMQAVLLVLAATAVAGEIVLRLASGRLGTDRAAIGAARRTVVRRPAPLTPPDLRARVAMAITALVVMGAAAAPLVATFPPDQVLLDEINMPPSLRHWMGTDASGRDLFSRLLYAGRTSLAMALGAAIAAGLAAAGLAAAVSAHPGWQAPLHGAGRVALAVPSLGVLLAAIATAGREPAFIAAGLAVIGCATLLGPLAALLADARRWSFVEAARASGAARLWIGERHLLPHLARPVLGATLALVPGFILLEATLGFLGFTVAPTTPSWGTLLWRAREAMHRGDWWLIAFPTVFLAASAWAFGALAQSLSRPKPPTYSPGARLRLGREWGAAARPAAPVPAHRVAARRRPKTAPSIARGLRGD